MTTFSDNGSQAFGGDGERPIGEQLRFPVNRVSTVGSVIKSRRWKRYGRLSAKQANDIGNQMATADSSNSRKLEWHIPIRLGKS